MTRIKIEHILKWSERHTYVLLLGIGLFLFYGILWPMISLALLSFIFYIRQHLDYLKGLSPFGGYANWVTFFRLLLVSFGGYSYQVWPDPYLFAIFTLAVLLDVLDGYLARRFEQSSDFGLYLDMESDAFFVALIASLLYAKGLLEAWLLFPAYLRYLYMIFLKVLPGEPKKEPKRSYASIIAGCFFVALLLPFILPFELYSWPLRICGALIVISFGISFWYQLFSPVSQTEIADI
ncbi:MAG: CDP-alcohol phosphatidyltransferase family protein [Bacteroidia bacterium]|nr:CDP-alcohol phosphatidyltransferase family protein [Bacteroidia bacterium]